MIAGVLGRSSVHFQNRMFWVSNFSVLLQYHYSVSELQVNTGIYME